MIVLPLLPAPAFRGVYCAILTPFTRPGAHFLLQDSKDTTGGQCAIFDYVGIILSWLCFAAFFAFCAFSSALSVFSVLCSEVRWNYLLYAPQSEAKIRSVIIFFVYLQMQGLVLLISDVFVKL